MLAALCTFRFRMLSTVPEALAETFPRNSLTAHHSQLIGPPHLEPIPPFCTAQLIHRSAETCPSLRPVVFTSSNCAATLGRGAIVQATTGSSCLSVQPPCFGSGAVQCRDASKTGCCCKVKGPGAVNSWLLGKDRRARFWNR